MSVNIHEYLFFKPKTTILCSINHSLYTAYFSHVYIWPTLRLSLNIKFSYLFSSSTAKWLSERHLYCCYRSQPLLLADHWTINIAKSRFPGL